jgi:hypothetical protein
MRPALKRSRYVIALATAAALSPLAANAQSWTKPGDETLLMQLGAVSANYNTNVRLDGNTTGSSGTPVDLEGDMGLNGDKSTPSLAASLRVAKRHRIDGAYDDNKRSASKTTQRTYVIGDTTIPAGTVLTAEQQTTLGYLGYRYSFMKSDTMEWAAGIGMYGGNFKFKFDANSPTVRVDESTTLPLPVLTLSGDFYLTERAIVSVNLRGLKVSIGEFDGSVYSAGLAGEYRFTNNFGIGAALDRFDLSVDATKPDFRGSVNLKTTSGRLYLTARF